MKVYAEKTFSKKKGEIFEAIGDVVIINKNNTLYGESASMNMKTGTFIIEGNVRYVSDFMTLWGARLEYQVESQKVKIHNARMETENFTIVASYIEKISEDEYFAEDAEFSTCKDCPESWSVYGEKLKLTLEQYARVWNGFIRMKGVEIFYIPYIVFPVKSKRQSGVLYPSFTSRVSEGVSLGVPYFWAISEDKDMTITPTFWTSRGWGGDLQYRQSISPNSWVHFDNKYIKDRLYETESKNRYFGEIEAKFTLAERASFYLRGTQIGDLDFLSDFSHYLDDRVLGTSLGWEGALSLDTEWLSFQIRGDYRRNLLVQNAYEFDRFFVQKLPAFRAETKPISLWSFDSRFFSRASFGGEFLFDSFRQREVMELGDIRNAERVGLKPYFETYLWSGDFFQLKNRYYFDAQFYKFKEGRQSFRKRVAGVETELFTGISKKIGRAYRERKLIDNVEKKEREEREKTIIGNIPSLDKNFFSRDESTTHYAYRHIQEFSLKHHYIFEEQKGGNQDFLNQISRSGGWFDYDDSLRRNGYLLGNNDTRKLLSPNNTIELQWNHLLYQDTPLDDLGETVSTSRIAYLRFSQGFDLDRGRSHGGFKNKLERLSISAGLSFDGWSLSFSEYYFYSLGEHLFDLSFGKSYSFWDINAYYSYNSLGTQLYTIGTRFRPTSFLELGYYNQYDMAADKSIRSIYEVDFVPRNDCWRLSVSFQKTLSAERFAFNILFNFGGEDFYSPRRLF